MVLVVTIVHFGVTTPYPPPLQNVGSSAIIWGVGSSNLHLPIPSSCPLGLKLLLEMCWWVHGLLLLSFTGVYNGGWSFTGLYTRLLELGLLLCTCFNEAKNNRIN